MTIRSRPPETHSPTPARSYFGSIMFRQWPPLADFSLWKKRMAPIAAERTLL